MTNMLVGSVHSIKWAVIDYDTRLVVVHRAQRRHHGLSREARLDTDRRRFAGRHRIPHDQAIVLTPSPPCEGAHRGADRPEQR